MATVSGQILGRYRADAPAVLNGNIPCHSRAEPALDLIGDGNPECFGCFLASCLRRGEKVGILRRSLQSPGYLHTLARRREEFCTFFCARKGAGGARYRG